MQAIKVLEVMTSHVEFCRETDSAWVAAKIMWDNDCGVVPVIDADGKLIGMITDRDICMAAYTQGIPLQSILVTSAMARSPVSIGADEDITRAHELMQRYQIHRLPVVDDDGKIIGIVSLCDLARIAGKDIMSLADVGRTLNAISQPRIKGASVSEEHSIGEVGKPDQILAEQPQSEPQNLVGQSSVTQSTASSVRSQTAHSHPTESEPPSQTNVEDSAANSLVPHSHAHESSSEPSGPRKSRRRKTPRSR